MSTAVNLYEVRFAALPGTLVGTSPLARYAGLWDRPDRATARFLGYTPLLTVLGPYAAGGAPVIPAAAMQLDIGDQELAPFVSHLALETVLDRLGQAWVGLHVDFPGSIGENEWAAALAARVPLVGIGAKAWTFAPTAFPLGPPTRVAAVPGAAPNQRTSLVLSWGAPADLGGEAVTGFQIESAAALAGPFTDLVSDTGNADTEYTHSGLTAGQTVYYRISAHTASGTGPASVIGSGTTES